MEISWRIGAGGLHGYALLQLPLLEHHFCCFWGCLLCGTKPVTVAIPPDYADLSHAVCGKLCNVWRLLEAPPIITSMANREKLELLGLDAQILLFEELKGDAPCTWTPKPSDVAFCQPPDRRNVGSPLERLSSGSTGVPKCIQITHQGVYR